MKKLFTILAIVALSISKAQSIDGNTGFNYNRDFGRILQETKKPDSKFYYAEQLKKFSTGASQTDLEVLSLLIGYTDNPIYKPYTNLFLDKELFDLNEAGKYEEVIKQCEAIQEKDPFQIKVIMEKKYAHEKLGHEDLAKIEKEKLRKIYSAMVFSSPTLGKDINHAMFALNPKDGQYFIKYLAKAKIGKMGSGQDDSGNFIDILEAKLNEESVMFYFNIEHAKRTFKF